ncbi:MAG: hypothetical protein ACRED9_00310 [Caulobacteraceae bacterium]
MSARKAASAPLPLAIRVVGYLDAYVGAMSRLLARSPHAAELIESKQALATPVFARFETRFQEALAALLRNGGIERSDAPLMFLAAAHGALKTGDLSEAAYRRRLTLLVEALIAGLERELGRPAKRPSALPPRIQNERRGAESRASERNR